jgi:hypothetical protein
MAAITSTLTGRSRAEGTANISESKSSYAASLRSRLRRVGNDGGTGAALEETGVKTGLGARVGAAEEAGTLTPASR